MVATAPLSTTVLQPSAAVTETSSRMMPCTSVSSGPMTVFVKETLTWRASFVQTVSPVWMAPDG